MNGCGKKSWLMTVPVYDEGARLRHAVRQGEARGRVEGKAEVARSMLRCGMQVELITELTVLTQEEIERLQA
jgi:predicted transposase YdaD